MRLLNIGCGKCYSLSPEWTNLDFKKTGEGVIAHNLREGIPFPDNTFDVVYQSHLLEHFSKKDGEFLISECYRVLKHGGVIRVVVPDLEGIIKEYLSCLENVTQDPTNKIFRSNYSWILLELFDQMVRNNSGGDMASFYLKNTLDNESYIVKRIGHEWIIDRDAYYSVVDSAKQEHFIDKLFRWFRIKYRSLRSVLMRLAMWVFSIDESAYKIGLFRQGGEVHQWMYDHYSISQLLVQQGFVKPRRFDAFNSYIEGWAEFDLDGHDHMVRKPDSLFIEAFK